MNETKTFTVDRRTWHRGQGPDGSALLRETDRTMCCLGHVARQCGISEDDIIGVTDPDLCSRDARNMLPSFLIDTRNGLIRNSDSCGEAMRINDDGGMFDVDREKKISKIFAKNGYQLFFEN